MTPARASAAIVRRLPLSLETGWALRRSVDPDVTVLDAAERSEGEAVRSVIMRAA